MASKSDRHPTDLAGLRGARLVLVDEVEIGRGWAESRVKTVTGGDTISVRFMHRDNFQYRPQFKLAVAGNDRPSLSRVGEAMRRRLHLVPLTVIILPEQRDKQLLEKLLEERDGILGWMLEGCAEWQRIGLAPPNVVLAAAEEYFEEQDVTKQWIEEACQTGPSHWASSKDLYASWSAWAKAGGHDEGSTKSLGNALRDCGLRGTKNGKGIRGWTGIALRRGSPGAESDE